MTERDGQNWTTVTQSCNLYEGHYSDSGTTKGVDLLHTGLVEWMLYHVTGVALSPFKLRSKLQSFVSKLKNYKTMFDMIAMCESDMSEILLILYSNCSVEQEFFNSTYQDVTCRSKTIIENVVDKSIEIDIC